MDIKELQVSNEKDAKKNHPWEYARSRVILSFIKKHLREHKGENVLDIGCGDVFFLTRFADKYPNFMKKFYYWTFRSFGIIIFGLSTYVICKKKLNKLII